MFLVLIVQLLLHQLSLFCKATIRVITLPQVYYVITDSSGLTKVHMNRSDRTLLRQAPKPCAVHEGVDEGRRKLR